MFDHLDDDHPFRPDTDFRTGALRRGRRLRRRRQVATGAAVCGSTALLALGGLGWYTRDQLDDIDRVEIGETLAPPPASPTEPINVLLVGTDENLHASVGVTGARGDAVMVLRADPATGRLSVLSVPRDLVIGDPNATWVRLNSTLETGGPAALVSTVEETLALPIHHYVQIDFAGFVDLVDQVRGVDLDFGVPMQDSTSGLYVETAGCQVLDGAQALAFARSRRLQFLNDGRWELDPTSDLGRMARQRVLAEAGISALVDLEANAGDVSALIDVLRDHAQIDEDLSNDELLAWSRWVISRGAANVTTYSLPVETATMDDGNIVLALYTGWDAVVDDFMHGVPPAPAPTGDGAPDPLVTPC